MINFHTHTFRCKHGNSYNDDEEIVLAAIKKGITVLGFSEHITISDFYPELGWGGKELADDYYQAVMMLKEKYKTQIAIHFGYEAEYFKEYHNKYSQLLRDGKCQFLIFGNHYRDSSCTFYYGKKIDESDLQKYLEQVIDGIKSGLFIYLAHPDVFMAGYRKWTKYTQEISEKICAVALEYNLPLELNMCGARKGKILIDDEVNNQQLKTYGYPFKEFWRIAKKTGNRIVIGYDAHHVNDFAHPANDYIFDLIKELDLTVEYDFNGLSKKS